MAASSVTTAYVERTASGTVFVDALLALGGDEMVTACEVTVAPTSVGASDALAVGSPLSALQRPASQPAISGRRGLSCRC